MVKPKLVAVVILTSLLCVAGQAQALSPSRLTTDQEIITSFVSHVIVNTDNSIDVTETIIYNTGPEAHHGIYRDIRPLSSQLRPMDISHINVTDEQGNAYQFTTSDNDGNVRVKIGDPDKTFLGPKTYVISYHATKAVGQLKDIDEIYWNVTGNTWPMPIAQASASITLPDGAKAIQSACYYGPAGSTSKCDNNTAANLNAYEGLTVAVGFPKGVVTPYTSADNVANFWYNFGAMIVGALLPLITLILSLIYWYKKGRDDKPTGVIIPQYDAPEGLTPMESVGIANEKVSAQHISAEIIYLATKGYLKIRELENTVFGLIKFKDYELTKLKDGADLPNDFDRYLLNGLFEGEAKIVKLSDLRDKFYTDAATVTKGVLNALTSKGYYKNLGRMKSGSSRLALILFMCIWASGFFGGFIGVLLFHGDVIPLIIGIFLSVAIYGLISHFNPSKTGKGVMAKEYILGLKLYLQIAETKRLEFHNAPEKKPELFEKLLPYAMVLGVVKIWAKEFEGIYTTPPSWYTGTTGSTFSAIAFSDSISSFSNSAGSTLTSSPSSSGSGGGGSSGGGGGGGGGGSW